MVLQNKHMIFQALKHKNIDVTKYYCDESNNRVPIIVGEKY